MYFFEEKVNTDINSEFDKDKNKNIIFNNKNYIILGLSILLIIFSIVVFYFINKTTYYITLIGKDEITIYKDEEYHEIGYIGYDNKRNDLSNLVQVINNVDTSNIGEYNVIYVLKKTQTIRKVKVVEKPKYSTYIVLNGDTITYLELGTKYVEKGYKIYQAEGSNLTSLVNISGKVDYKKIGTYKLIYSVTDDFGVTISTERTVIVTNSDISLTLSNDKYTNKDIYINLFVQDNYFDYIELPNGEVIKNNKYSYLVSENGTYSFKIYNKLGKNKISSIEVSNIDKEKPTGNCSGVVENGTTVLKINGYDNSSQLKYSYNNFIFTDNKYTINNEVEKANIDLIDEAGNSTRISCSLEFKQSISITSIKNDGIILTIKAKTNSSSKIKGYYFSYDGKRHDNQYVASTSNSIDVVRLPGTTYVWAVDSKNSISQVKVFNLTNSVLKVNFGVSGYNILNTKLSDYLSSKGSSLQEFNNLIFRSVRAAGINTKIGAATAGITLQSVLAEKYHVKIPYKWGIYDYGMGANGSWGITRSDGTLYGFCCDGFVNWSYVNAGIGVSSDFLDSSKNYYLSCFNRNCGYRVSNGEIGDILAKNGHVRLIVGKEGNKYIVAEEYGTSDGLVLNYHDMNNSEYIIISGDYLIKNYQLKSDKEYPSGY